MKKIKMRDLDPASVEKLAGLLTVGQMAAYYGIVRDTFYRWLKNRPELGRAYEAGKAQKTAMVAGQLMRNVLKGDTTAAIFYLKTQANWSERVQDAEEELMKQQTKLTKTSVTEAVKELERLGVRLPDFANEPPPECPQTPSRKKATKH